MGARRALKGPNLTREQRMQEAVKIIGKDNVRRADIEAIVDQVDKQCERSKHTRQWQGSTKQKLFAKQFGAALRPRALFAPPRIIEMDLPKLREIEIGQAKA